MQFTMKYDMMDWFYPMRHLVGACLQNNVLPIWNPYTNLGYPLHTDPQSGALYPIVWVLAWLFGYSVYTINLEFILHLLIAFYGMKKLSEAFKLEENITLIIGLCYACCGFFIGNAQHLSWIIAAAWIPYVATYYIRIIQSHNWRDGLKLSLVSFLLLTGGYPAFTVTAFYLMGISFLIVVGIKLWKKDIDSLKKVVISNVVFGTSFLIQSIVFLKYFLESLPFLVRTESLSLENIQLLPFSPNSFLSFVLPFVTGGHSAFFKTDVSMANAYFGLIPLLFLVYGFFKKPKKETFLLWGFAIFFLLVSLGDYSFLRAWLYHYIPMMDLFRYPALFRVFVIIPFLLLFGISFQSYFKNKENSKEKLILRFFISGMIIILASLWFYSFLKEDFLLPENFTAASIVGFFNKSSNSQMVLIQAPIQLGILALLLGKTFLKKGISFLKFACLLILLDLFLSVQLNCFLTITSEAKVTALQEKLNAFPDAFPIPHEKVQAVSHHGNKEYYPIWYNLNILQKRVANDGYNNFKFKAYRTFKDKPEAQEILNNLILFDSGKSLRDSLPAEEKSEIKITLFSPTRMEAELSMPNNSELTLLQYFYPGWKVYLNGKEVEPFLKEDIFISLKVPKGNHQIVFEYYPNNFLIYLIISFFAFLSLLIYFIKRKIYN